MNCPMMLSAVYGRKVMLFIDEYDIPLAKAGEKDTTENHFYNKMLDQKEALVRKG